MNRFAIFVAAVLVAASPAASAALKIFACEPEWAALAKELGDTDVDAFSASTAVQDIHRIQARPSLIARYRQADLVVCTGAELEVGWLPALADKANNPAVRPGSKGYFEAAQHVKMLEVPSSVDRSLGDVHPYGNPHIQTNPANILPVAQALVERLAQLDAAHAEAYRERGARFAARWQEALKRWQAAAAPLKGVEVVSHHKTWVYLYDWLGVTEITTLEPKPGIPPSGAQLERVLAAVKGRPVKAVIYSSYENDSAARWLAGRTGIPAVQLPISVGGAPGADDLFKLYDVLLERLLAAQAKAP